MSNSIYLVKDEQADLVKIGVSADVKRRVGQLKRGSNSPLTLLGVLPGLTYSHEKGFHNFLKAKGKHVRLEWFKLDHATTMFLYRFGWYYTQCITGSNEHWRTVWATMTEQHLEMQLERSWEDGLEWSHLWGSPRTASKP